MHRLTLLVLLVAGLAQAQTSYGPFDYQVVPIGEGIWLLQRPDPTRQPVEGNITVIAGSEGLMVVDTGGTAMSGRNAIEKIGQLSDLPVRWIVNTHWHGDHHLGNVAFREAWPDVQIITQENTARDMSGEAMNYLDGQDEMMRQSIGQLAQMLVNNTDAQGNELDAPTRARYEQIQADVQLMLEAYGQMELVGADRSFENELELDLGGRSAVLIHPGRGNTEGDVVVHLPDDKVMISGDLVVAPTPYGFHSYPEEWISSLERIRALDWQVLIPGHGDPMRDAAYIDLLIQLIDSMRQQAKAAVGVDLEVFREQLDVTEFQQQIAGDDPKLQQLFQLWWVEPFTKSVWLEANGMPIIQGDDSA